MLKAPNRPDGEVSQTYNSGIVDIYTITDAAVTGYAPVRLRTKAYTLPFAERRVGINRRYLASQNQVEVDRVIRVQAVDITTQDEATIDGTQYRIDLVQTVPGIYPPSLDLTLVRVSSSVGGDL